jgi:hypothetical protein
MKTSQFRRSGRTGSRKSQAGFGMAIALAVLAVFALIAGAIALSSKGGTSKTDLETSKTMATSIVNRGNELLQAVQRVSQDRDIKTMTLSSTSVVGTSFGLYDPAIGVATDVKIPGKAFAANGADVSFTLDKTYTVVGIGSGGATVAAVSAILPGLSLQTCQLINKTVFSTPIDAVPATGTTALPNMEGCIDVSGTYTYYKAFGPAA